jgi:hypothetical protein
MIARLNQNQGSTTQERKANLEAKAERMSSDKLCFPFFINRNSEGFPFGREFFNTKKLRRARNTLRKCGGKQHTTAPCRAEYRLKLPQSWWTVECK